MGRETLKEHAEAMRQERTIGQTTSPIESRAIAEVFSAWGIDREYCSYRICLELAINMIIRCTETGST